MAEAQVRLRPITDADLPSFVQWANDPEVVEFMGGDVGQVTLESQREWLARITAPDSTRHSWAIEVEGRLIGNCGLKLDSQGQTADYVIAIGDRRAWGKGYGTAATREALRRGFQEMELHRIHLRAFPENPRGLRCYENAGFRREGYEKQSYFKGGKWRDVVRMAILREEWEEINRAAADDSAVRIRAFTLADYEEVAALWKAACLGPRASDTRDEVAKKLRRDPDLFLVACLGGRIVGTVIGGWDGRRGWVYRMAVHPDFQRRGIGRQLVYELEERLRGKGALAINLIYDTENAQARALYHSLGYRDRDEVSVLGKALEPKEGT